VEASNTPTIRRLTPHAVTNFRVHLVRGKAAPVQAAATE
jgi:hypothetical protein